MTPAFPIVLASTSPARLALMRSAGIDCLGVAPPVDEASLQHDDPATLAALRAAAKARSVDVPGACVIGADQVAWMGSEVFGKPIDPVDHRARLRALRGRTHTLTTAVLLRHGGQELALRADTRLTFRADLLDAEIDAYVDTREGSGCAGGYAAEGLGSQLLATIEGDFFNVLGLPLLPLIGALRSLGWRPSFPRPVS
jgi:septum formation protein